MLMAAGSIIGLFSQTMIQGPTISNYFTPNTTGTTSWVPPSSTQQLKRMATANIIVTPIGTWPTNYATQIKPAIDYAVSIWNTMIVSPVDIHVNIYWQASGSILGNTAANLITNFIVAPLQPATIPGYYYPKALANKLHGTELNSTKSDMDIYISSNPPYPWYYGTDAKCPIANLDFVTNLLHEIGHGLGFFTDVRLNTATPAAIAYGLNFLGGPKVIMDYFVANTSGTLLTSLTSPSSALTSFCTSNAVVFNGANAVNQNGGVKPKLSAPSPFVNGANINHLDKVTYPKGNSNTLLTPNKTNGEAVHNIGNFTLGALEDIGWSIVYPVGIEDAVAITSCPTFLSENQVFTCNGTFTDHAPYGATLYNPSWKIEAYHTGGKVVLKSGNGYYGFTNVNLGALPVGYDWIREWSDGTVRTDVVFYGTDNQGFYHEAKARVGIYYRPETPSVVKSSVVICTRTVAISFYAKGATSYKILYAKTPNVSESTPGVVVLNLSGNTSTHTFVLPTNGTYYINVRGFNTGGGSALGNEVSAYVNTYDASCGAVCCGGGGGGANISSFAGPLDNTITISTISSNNYIINFPVENKNDRLITVYNTNSQVVLTQIVGSQDMQAPLNLNSLLTGVYLINITSGNEQLYQKKILVTQ